MVWPSARRIPVVAIGLGDIHLAANDRLHACFLGSLVESNGSEEISMVGHGDRRHFVFCSGLSQRLVIAGAVQKTETGMQMQMNKRRRHFLQFTPTRSLQ